MKRKVDIYTPKYNNCIVLTNGNTEKIYLNLIKERYESRILDKYYGTEFYYLPETDKIYFDNQNGNFSFFDIGKINANCLALVKTAIKLKKFMGENLINSNLWCVFDKDREDKGSNPFDSAIALAESNGINYAFSNRQFEVWFIMHYRKLKEKLSANKLIEDIDKHYAAELNKKYAKGEEEFMREAFLPHTERAMLNAKEVFAYFESRYGRRPKSEWASSTSVFRLLEDLGI